MVIVNNAEQFRNAIVAFEETVELKTYDPVNLINQTYKKYPEVLGYLCSLNTAPSFYGKVVVNLKYRNQDVPLKFIKLANTDEKFLDFMHETVSYYRLKSVIILKNGVRWEQLYQEFFDEYHAYYSNLTQIQVEGYSTFDDDKIAVTLNCSYRIGSIMLGIMERAVDEEVARLKQVLFCDAMPDRIKAYVAHNYLAKSITYYNRDDASPLDRSYMQSAYGALINKKCVCQGYAEAYKRILDEIGIENGIICGKIIGSEEYHAWNVIVLDGKAYHVDVTWDSLGNGAKNDEHFAKNDDYFKSTRIWARRPKYVCNSTVNILPEIRAEIIMNTRKYILAGVDRNYLR